MIAGLIFVISSLTLLQFFVSYSRSLLAASRSHQLSDQTREICGLTAKTVRASQFPRLLRLIDLCPEHGGDGFQVRVVHLYFRLLGLAHTMFRRAIPSATQWIDAERGGCAYAVAVALDRRIAYSRTMMSHMASH